MTELHAPETWSDRSADPPTAGVLVRATGDEVVVSIAGELDLASAPTVLRCLESVASRPIQELTIDLAELTFLDSSGLNALNHRAGRGQCFAKQQTIIGFIECGDVRKCSADVCSKSQIPTRTLRYCCFAHSNISS